MQSRFDFLAEQFPKLADYGHKAEQALGTDNNICLLNLGQVAETITQILSNRNGIQTVSPDVLLEKGIIDKGTCLKLRTLTETKNDYCSESSASRLMASAVELCEWFKSVYGVSKFSFLGDMFPENEPCPPLACLAEYGADAEANLHSNARYCLLCLGDIEEAITNIFLERSGIILPDNLEQHKRINNLLGPLGKANKDKIDVLHELRQARNDAVHDAVHGRYNAEEAAKRLTEKALDLCEWVFMRIVSPEDFVRGRITRITEDGLSVSVGRICGRVTLDEIPPEKQGTYREGECRVFRVKAKGSDGLELTLIPANTDPWTHMKRYYERYKAGQVLTVKVKRVTENYGAFVSVGESGEIDAIIPKSELTAKRTLRPNDTLKTRVLEVNPEHYPYMLLSTEAGESEQEVSRPENCESESEPPAKSVMSDKEFITFCRQATREEVAAALASGTKPNARSKYGTTPLMEAAHMNEDLGAIQELLDGGAKVNVMNEKGNTALIYAAMHNVPEVVRLLCENGAEIEPINNQGRDALSYALKNPKLKNDEGIIRLLTSEEREAVANPPTPSMSDRQFISLCKNGKERAILSAIDGGANVNAKDSHGTTVLMYVSIRDIPRVVEAMVERGADVNAVNKNGVTPLLNAVMNSRYRNIKILLEHGAEVRVANKKGKTLLEYAREKLSNKKGEACLREIEAALGLGDEAAIGQEGPHSEGLEATQSAETPLIEPEVPFTEEPDLTQNEESPIAEPESPQTEETDVTQNAETPLSEQEAPFTEELDATHSTEPPLTESEDPHTEEPDVTQSSESSLTEQETPQDTETPLTEQESPFIKELDATQYAETPLSEQEAPFTDETPLSEPEASFTEETDATQSSESSLTEEPNVTQNAETPFTEQEAPFTPESPLTEPEAPHTEESPLAEQEAPFTEELDATQDTESHLAEPEAPLTENPSVPTTSTSLSPDQHEESLLALKLTFQRDILKIARSGSIDDLAQAINSGVSVNVKNKSLATPLMFAAKTNSSDVIDLIIKSGAQLNSQDSKGNTPLIYAAAYNTDDVVDALLDAGADTTLKNLDGYSALDYAKLNYRLIDTHALLRLQE